MEELTTRGRVYAYRYRPEGRLYGKPINEYKGKCLAGKAFQVMIENNLDFEVALYPYELVTYGETGSVCQNWLQYRLIKKYLEELTEDQTLVVESGNPLGLFPSKPTAPRVIITNSMMIGEYDNLEDWEVAEEMGVANYGQMTAGGWMYIGPQGIVHGTFNTILNAGRKYLGVAEQDDLAGYTFVSSGLGGMNLACIKYRLLPEEVLTAVTINPACAINRGDRVGTLEVGKQGDLVIWDAPDMEMLCYRFCSNLAAKVIKKGKIVK